MADEQNEGPSGSERLDAVIAGYLEAEGAGEAPDRQELLARHPDLAEELAAFFADHDRMKALAGAMGVAGAAVPADAETLPPGAVLTPPLGTKVHYFGDYELLEELGRGGMGVVYKARQISLNRIVALKMVLAGQLAAEEDIKRFYTEAEAAAQLDHPGIVPIFEVGQHEGQHYFSMGYVEGQSLSARVAQGPLPPREAAEVVKAVAEAVHYAHQKGVIHRDLKPANILLHRVESRELRVESREGKVESQKAGSSLSTLNSQLSTFSPRITDFGLAKRVTGDSGLTATGQILGTPSYMPPEQASGKLDQISPASDIYALGAVLYTLLTGRPPFQAATPLDTVLQVLDQEPVPPRQLNAGIPRDLETIALKCLEKDRSRRYATAQDLAAELARYLAGEPILARPVSRPERVWRWCRRNPAVAGLTAAVAVSLVAGTVISTCLALVASDRAEVATAARSVAETEWQRAETERDHADTERGRANEKAAEALAQKERAEKQLLRSERLFYAGQIASAQREWETKNASSARAYLDACRWDFRGWEHDYLHTLFTSTQQTRTPMVFPESESRSQPSGQLTEPSRRRQHSGPVSAQILQGDGKGVCQAAFSPDGKRIVSAGVDKTVRVWDIATGQETLRLKGHRDAVMTVAFSPDGKRIASGSEDRMVKVWDATSGREILTLKGHTDSVLAVAFSPDGKRIVSGSEESDEDADMTVKVWDVITGRETLRISARDIGPVFSAAFSPDGKRIAVGAMVHYVTVWDATSGREVLTLNGHTGPVLSVTFSRDGKRVLTGSQDRTLKVWDASSGQEMLALRGHARDVLSVALSPDGKRIVSGSGDETVKVWDTTSGQETIALRGHTHSVSSVAFSPDGLRILSGSLDGTVRVWDASSHEETRILTGHADSIYGVAFSPDGKRLVSGGYDWTVRAWDLASGQETLRLRHDDEVYGVAFSPDGKRILSGSADGTLKVWDATSGQEMLSVLTKAFVMRVAFSPDGKRLASVDRSGILSLWDAASGQKTLTGRSWGRVLCITFSPDGKRIATACENKTVRVWDAQTGAESLTLRGHTDMVGCVAFSPDGKSIASGSQDGTAKVWDAQTGAEALTLRGHTSSVRNLAFSADAKRIISGSGGGNRDHAVTVWDAATGKELARFKGRSGWVLCMAFSADRKQIASGCEDGTLMIWDATDANLPAPAAPPKLPQAGPRAPAVAPRAKPEVVARLSWPAGVPKELAMELGGGVKMEFVLIPAGCFLMGDENGDEDEKPVHKVTITKPFYLAKYELTQEQWQAVMGRNPSHFQGPKNPVAMVEWDDCQAFLAKLNEKFGSGGAKFGLPTEAQWEYACRAGTTTRWSFGDDPAKLDDYAWCGKNANGTAHPVGQKKPNAWGLYDMHGNVWEWCADWFGDGYYPQSPADDPVGPASGRARVLRGGSWRDDGPEPFRCAVRGACTPHDCDNFVGFRVARTLTP